MTDSEKQREEAKREAAWNSRERWRIIQETITWADAQKTGGRNTMANRLREQRQKQRVCEIPAESVKFEKCNAMAAGMLVTALP